MESLTTARVGTMLTDGMGTYLVVTATDAEYVNYTSLTSGESGTFAWGSDELNAYSLVDSHTAGIVYAALDAIGSRS